MILETVITAFITSVVGFLVATVWYQNRKEKRDKKVEIFEKLVSTQAMLDYGKVRALNSIEIVFYGCDDVVSAWREYKKALKIDKETLSDKDKEAIKKSEILLLEKMAKHLKYKNITWDIVDDPYYPNWISQQEEGIMGMYRTVNNLGNWIGQQSSTKQVHSPGKGRKNK